MGLTPSTISTYCAGGLTKAGVEYIDSVRASPPARRVGGTRFLSVSSRFPSQNMGCTIQAESRTGEYPFVLALELDEDVLEYYDQPYPVRVTRIRAGRNHVSTSTPDFLVLRSTRVEVIEVKPRKKVEEARDKYPDEWAMRNGHWVCLPVAEQFDSMGILYRVHLAESIGALLAANLNILVAAKRLPPHSEEDALLKRLNKTIRADKATTIQMVVNDLALKDASIVLRWIAGRRLFAATSEQLLTDIRTARVFADEAAMERFVAARHIDLNGACASEKIAVTKAIPQNNAIESHNQGSDALTDRQLELAWSRYQAALPAIEGKRPPTRNERRQIERMKAAVALGRGCLHGFVPLFHKQGNRLPRITGEQEALMAGAISAHFSTAARRSVRWAYASINWGVVPKVSYKAFLAFTRRIPKHEVAKARSGHRSWLAARPQTHPDVRAIWPTMAWELVHIDHTPIDEKVWGQLGVAQILGRPWLTTMIDGWSHAALAFWLSFSPPSWQSLAMLLRDCVRRHHRLPLAWISDQGSEFGGIFWERFSANHACTKFDRAVADARCGSQVERTFHMLHRDLIYQLDGNMQNDREWRSATTSHKSDATSRYLLERIYSEIDHYLFEYHNRKPHGPNIFSPQQKLDQSESDLGGLLRPVAYDMSFRIETAHHATKQAYRVNSRRGIRVGQRIYWNDIFAQPKYDGERVDVRNEPFDSSMLYAHIEDRWVECVAYKHAELNSLEEFGRWAQSAIDYYGRPYAAAVRRAADERFATHQVETWAAEQGEATSSNGEMENVNTDSAVESTFIPNATATADNKSDPIAAPSPFDRLRSTKVEPLKEMAP
jgi:putative transposase